MKRTSRRSFLRVLAAGSAALAAGAVAPLARPAQAARARAARARSLGTRVRASKSPASGPSPALLKEIANQKKSLAGTLETIRRYSLPPGSPPAFVFRPLRPARARGGR